MEIIDRTERLLVMILLQLMKGASQGEQIRRLNLAGLSNIEIANVLETSPAVVSQSLYEVRKIGKKSRRREFRPKKKASSRK